MLDALQYGKHRSTRALALECDVDRRTVERIARETGLPLPSRSVEVNVAEHLLTHGRTTIPELAASYGVSRSTMQRRLRAAGLRAYGPHLRPQERCKILELLGQGVKPPEVARRVGRTLRTVQRYQTLRRRGQIATTERCA